MKKIEAIIQPAKLDEIKETLNKVNIKGLTITQVMGCGATKGWTEYYRGSEVFLNVLPKIMIMIVVPDERVDEIVSAIIQTCRTDHVGDGKIFISNVERAIRIRSREEGDSVL
ncbi:MAG: P-II family nitrogen regulator [Eubacteriaceae bacterium]